MWEGQSQASLPAVFSFLIPASVSRPTADGVMGSDKLTTQGPGWELLQL